MSKYIEVQNRLSQILERADVGDRVSRNIDLFLMALVVVNIISITLESVPRFYAAYKLLFTWIEIISVGIFTIEYLCRVWVATLSNLWPVRLCWRLQSARQIYAQLQWPGRPFVHPALLSARVLPLFRSADFTRIAAASHSKIVTLQFGYGGSV